MIRTNATSNLPSTLFLLVLIVNFVAIYHVKDQTAQYILLFTLGMLLVGALEAVHQATHNNLFSMAWINQIIGTLLGLVLLLNFVRYKAFHANHHAHAATYLDPERVLYESNDTGSLVALLFAPLFYLGFALTIQRSDYVAKKRKGAASFNTALLLVFIVFVLALTVYIPETMLFMYWLPLALYAWLDFLLNQAEHYGMRELMPGEDPGKATNNLLLPKLLSVAFLYRNLHRVHHLEPRTPWHMTERVYIEQGEPGISFYTFFRRYLSEGPRLWGVR